MDEMFLIAAYRSRQAVMRLDGALRRAGIKTDIVSTPRAVAVGCGLSVRFEESDLGRVRKLVQAENTSTFLGIYRVQRLGGRILVSPVAG